MSAALDLAYFVQRALEECGVLQEKPDQAVKPDRAEVLHGRSQTEGETNQPIGRKTDTVSYPSVSVKRSD